MRLQIDIELLEPVILTRSSATTGAHRTLRFVPGACLLGAAVAALGYDAADPATWHLFHADTVRFGDGLPVAGDDVAVPAPLSWHRLKRGESTLHDLGHGRPEGQLEQVREGFVTASGARVVPQTEFALRTAIAPDEDRALEGFLHGAEQLVAGQRFRAFVTADAPALLDRIAGAFDGKVHRFGRARTAEVGSVRTTVRRVEDVATVPRKAKLLRVLCASDVALRDPLTGTPRLRPGPADLGLPAGWTLDPERTFVRTRRYSPFNGKRRRSDPERQVIAAGSVWTFTGPTEVDVAAVQKAVRGGIGEHRRDGLGVVLVDPPQLASDDPKMTDWTAPAEPRAEIPRDELGAWLRARIEEAAKVARVGHDDVARFRARNVRPAQWGEIRTLARRARTAKTDQPVFVAELERHLFSGARKLAKGWGARSEGKTAGEALMEWARERHPAALESLASRVVRPGVSHE